MRYLLAVATALLLATAVRAQDLKENIDDTQQPVGVPPSPFEFVSKKAVPGDNFRILIRIVVKVKDGETVEEVDGVCLHEVAGVRRAAPPTGVERLEENEKHEHQWVLDFNVPKNPDYFFEIYSLKKGEVTDAKLNKQGKKVKKVKSTPLLVQLKL